MSIDRLLHPQIDLFADGVADPQNIAALASAARLCGTRLFFHHPGRGHVPDPKAGLPAPPLDVVRRTYDLILALEPGPGAMDVWAYRVPAGRRVALFVGNERRGLSPPVARLAAARLQIPMRSQGVQSLNVAAAAAAALTQLGCRPGRGPAPESGRRRPDVVFLYPADPAELGSSLRTAWALGWDRAGLVDSRHVWFTPDRTTYVQGRGAARRHRNPLHVVPCDPAARPYEMALLITLRGPGPSLWRTSLPLGAGTAVFLPDESGDPAPPVGYSLSRMARRVIPVHLDLPAANASYHYRLVTAIALAEVARRLGWGAGPR